MDRKSSIELDPKYVAKLVRQLYNERSKLLEVGNRSDEAEARLVSIENAIGMYPTCRNPYDQEAMDLIRKSAEILREHPIHNLYNRLAEKVQAAVDIHVKMVRVSRPTGMIIHACEMCDALNEIYKTLQEIK